MHPTSTSHFFLRAFLAFVTFASAALISVSAQVANYQDDFSAGGAPRGWRYLWNQPDGWPANPDRRTGTIGDPSSYRDLIPFNNIYTPDGDNNDSNNAPAGNLRLNSTGGNVGHGPQGMAGARDRYAIAAYTIPSEGHYRITNTTLRGVGAGTGLHLVVHVDDQPFVVDLLTTSDIRSRFDTFLGHLRPGQTVYVGVGPAGNPNNDSFTLNFTIRTYDPETVTASPELRSRYSHAIRGVGMEAANWTFGWNAPPGWVRNASSGTMTAGGLEPGMTVTPMIIIPRGVAYYPDGDSDGTNNAPAGKLRLDPWGGHPGSAGNFGTMSRYAIASYKVPRDGTYMLGQSFLALSPDSADGVEVVVLVNGVRQYSKEITPGARGYFDGELKSLQTGDEVQVAVGAKGNDIGDEFAWDFEIAYASPFFPESARVIHVDDFGAVGDGSHDDGPAIRAAVSNAASSGQPTIIDFSGRKVYRVRSYTGSNVVRIENKRDIYLRGNGARLSLNPPNRMLMIRRSENIRVEGLTVTYDPLPYFQGKVVGYSTSNHTVDIQVYDRYPMPAVDAPNVSDARKRWRYGKPYGGTSGHYWISTVKAIDEESTANRIVRVKHRWEGRNYVETVGQRAEGMIIAVPGKGHTGNYIVKITESSHVQFRDVLIHQVPEFIFLVYGNFGPVRFDNVDILVPNSDERFVSWRDGFHVKDNRYGPVWEECDFDSWAMQDDLFNLTAMWGFAREVNGRYIRVNPTALEGHAWRSGDWIVQQNMNGTSKGSARMISCVFVESINRYEIELDRAIPNLAQGDRLYNEQASNRGAIIRKSRTYEGDAGRGSWRQRTPVLVEDNDFDDFYMWISAESSSEGPNPVDMIIRRNRIRGGQTEIITNGYPSAGQPTSNIVFQDNTFDRGHVWMNSAKDVKWFFNNTITNPNQNRAVILRSTNATFIGNMINGLPSSNYLSWIGQDSPSRVTFDEPLRLTAVPANGGQVVLNWTPAPAAEGYEVWRASSSVPEFALIADVALDTTYRDSVSLGEMYVYRVAPRNSRGISLPVTVDMMEAAPELKLRFSFEGEGTSAVDSVSGVTLDLLDASGLPADLHGAPGTGATGVGRALELTGETSGGNGPVARTVEDATVDFGSLAEFTLTMWVKPTAPLNVENNFARFFVLGDATTEDAGLSGSLGLINNADRFAPDGSSTSVQAWVNTQGTPPDSFGALDLPVGEWTFVSVSSDGESLKLFRGSETEAVSLVSVADLPNGPIEIGETFNLFIGNNAGQSAGFRGFVDEVRFYQGAASAGMIETFRQVQGPPFISSIPDQELGIAESSPALAFTIHDADLDASLLSLEADSSDPAVVPVENIVLGGTGTARTVTVTPAPGMLGSSAITLTVGNGEFTASETFLVTVDGNHEERWRFEYFGTTEITELSADDQDPDGDGRTNAFEYLVGTNPAEPDHAPLLAIESEDGELRLSFVAAKASGPGYEGLDRYYTLEKTESLLSPEAWTGIPEFTDLVGNDEEVTVNYSLGESAAFFRLNVRVE